MLITEWPYAMQAAFWVIVLNVAGVGLGVAGKQILSSWRRR